MNLKQMSYCTLADNVSSLNATNMVQLRAMKPRVLVPLQLINENPP